jgi:hypothetical protein
MSVTVIRRQHNAIERDRDLPTAQSHQVDLPRLG